MSSTREDLRIREGLLKAMGYKARLEKIDESAAIKQTHIKQTIEKRAWKPVVL